MRAVNRTIIGLLLFAAVLGANIRVADAAPDWAQVGEAAPELVLPTHDGKSLDLGSLRGKVVVINFMASWCRPCIHELGDLVSLANHYTDKNFELVFVSIDREADSMDSVIDEKKITQPVLLDQHGKMQRRFGALRLPLTYVIDADGVIVEKFFGPRRWTQDKFLSAFDQLLGIDRAVDDDAQVQTQDAE